MPLTAKSVLNGGKIGDECLKIVYLCEGEEKIRVRGGQSCIFFLFLFLFSFLIMVFSSFVRL